MKYILNFCRSTGSLTSVYVYAPIEKKEVETILENLKNANIWLRFIVISLYVNRDIEEQMADFYSPNEDSIEYCNKNLKEFFIDNRWKLAFM